MGRTLFFVAAMASLCIASGRGILQIDTNMAAAPAADPMQPSVAASGPDAAMQMAAMQLAGAAARADADAVVVFVDDVAAPAPAAAPEGAYQQAASSAEPAPRQESASTPAPAPAPAAPMAKQANVVATVVGSGVAFAEPDYIEITGVAPVVPFYATQPVWRAGSWNLSQFASPDLTIGEYWLGAPDGALFGYNENGTQVVLVLGPITNPTYNATNQTLRFTARPITRQADIGLSSGIASYAANANGPELLRAAPSQSLTGVSLSIDLAVLPTKNSTARTTYQEVQGANNRVQKVKTAYEVDTVNPEDLGATPLSAAEQQYMSAAPASQ